MALPERAQGVQDALAAAGFSNRVVEMPTSTRTAEEAAQACGCAVAQIAKSLVFRGEAGEPVLVIASGANRVHERRLGFRLNPEELVAMTGGRVLCVT